MIMILITYLFFCFKFKINQVVTITKNVEISRVTGCCELQANYRNYLGIDDGGCNNISSFLIQTETFLDASKVCYKRLFHRHKGRHHGFYVEKTMEGSVTRMGRYSHGLKTGYHWLMCQGGGYLVAELDSNDRCHGDQAVFIYPDLETCIVGSFSDGNLVQGVYGHITGVWRELGVPIPEASLVYDSPSFSFDPSTASRISSFPLLKDLYESQHVYVDNSTVEGAGEGLFAKRRITRGQVCAFFNGIKVHNDNVDLDVRGGNGAVGSHENHLHCGDTCLHVYCGSLAHKTCHSFVPNTDFQPCWHPRFGRIMSIVARRDIFPGEELFVNYNYKLVYAPPWYQQQWFHHARSNLGWSGLKIESHIQNLASMSGVLLKIPNINQ